MPCLKLWILCTDLKGLQENIPLRIIRKYPKVNTFNQSANVETLREKKCGALKPTYVCINILGFPPGAVYNASEERESRHAKKRKN